MGTRTSEPEGPMHERQRRQMLVYRSRGTAGHGFSLPVDKSVPSLPADVGALALNAAWWQQFSEILFHFSIFGDNECRVSPVERAIAVFSRAL